MLANGSGLPVYGKIFLSGKIKNSSFTLEFLVSKIAHEGILGMLFPIGEGCTLVWMRGSWHGEGMHPVGG